MNGEKNNHWLNAGVALAIGLVISSIILGWSYTKTKKGDEAITVTGSARKRIKSDLVLWSAAVTYQEPKLTDAYPPKYYFTQLGDLKIEMLGEAAKDGKTRAEQIAASTGNRIGAVRSAKMGVLQITAADSTEVSDAGISDTTSIDKDITAVVNVSFAVE